MDKSKCLSFGMIASTKIIKSCEHQGNSQGLGEVDLLSRTTSNKQNDWSCPTSRLFVASLVCFMVFVRFPSNKFFREPGTMEKKWSRQKFFHRPDAIQRNLAESLGKFFPSRWWWIRWLFLSEKNVYTGFFLIFGCGCLGSTWKKRHNSGSWRLIQGPY